MDDKKYAFGCVKKEWRAGTGYDRRKIKYQTNGRGACADDLFSLNLRNEMKIKEQRFLDDENTEIRKRL